MKKMTAMVFAALILLSACSGRPEPETPEAPSANQSSASEEKPTSDDKKEPAVLEIYKYSDDMSFETVEFEADGADNCEKKLSAIAKKLSQECFNGNIIEVSIKDGNNAVINLKDSEGKEWPPYFQGSLGGKKTEAQLLKAFFQEKQNEDWIDSIEIYYNGEPAYEQFDHFCLVDIYKRENMNEYLIN